eukprot:10540732-Alexandrium_andersonii.AAC.1
MSRGHRPAAIDLTTAGACVTPIGLRRVPPGRKKFAQYARHARKSGIASIACLSSGMYSPGLQVVMPGTAQFRMSRGH